MRTLVTLIATLLVLGGAEEDSQYVGYLRPHVHAAGPISLDATSRLTYHLIHRAELPVSLDISDFSYQPLFVLIMAMDNEADIATEIDLIGHNMGESIVPKKDHVQVSGVGGVHKSLHSWLPEWPKRSGLTLFQDEGYAREIRLLPGWVTAKDMPATVRNWLLVRASPSIRIRLPQRRPDALAPGKSIAFDEQQRIRIPGTVPVPFKRSIGKQPEPPAEPPLKEHDLRVTIELDGPANTGKDVVATYLVGNHGSKSVWIRQNTLVPALATWEVLKGDRVVVTIDGAALKPLLALLPDREAIPLNPGEFLTWRRPLLASALPPKPGTYRLRLRIPDAPWYPVEPTPNDQAQMTTLTGEATLNIK